MQKISPNAKTTHTLVLTLHCQLRPICKQTHISKQSKLRPICKHTHTQKQDQQIGEGWWMNGAGLRRWVRKMMNRVGGGAWVGDDAWASARWCASFGGGGEDDDESVRMMGESVRVWGGWEFDDESVESLRAYLRKREWVWK